MGGGDQCPETLQCELFWLCPGPLPGAPRSGIKRDLGGRAGLQGDLRAELWGEAPKEPTPDPGVLTTGPCSEEAQVSGQGANLLRCPGPDPGQGIRGSLKEGHQLGS